MITLSEQEVKELQDYCLEMPGKYGISIINFLNQKIALAQVEKETINKIEVKDPEPVENPVKAKKSAKK